MEKITILKEIVKAELERVEREKIKSLFVWTEGYGTALEFVLEEIDELENDP